MAGVGQTADVLRCDEDVLAVEVVLGGMHEEVHADLAVRRVLTEKRIVSYSINDVQRVR
jgi:hypothetical protein